MRDPVEVVARAIDPDVWAEFGPDEAYPANVRRITEQRELSMVRARAAIAAYEGWRESLDNWLLMGAK